MNFYVNKQIGALGYYAPPLDGRRANAKKDDLLLDFNERSIPLNKKVLASLKGFIVENQIQIYPEYNNLATLIATYAGVKSEQLMFTNGSDQGIDLVFRCFTAIGDKVIIPSPSFAFFYQVAGCIGNQIIMPLYKKQDPAFPLKEVLDAIDATVRLVVICNPNNPTGTLLQLKDLLKIIKKAALFGVMVYVDEAYFEFSKITAAGLIEQFTNLVITRTFSKAFGLASLRIGYVISCKENISELAKVRGPYDVNMLAVVAAKAALECRSEMEDYVYEVMNDAKPLVEDFFRSIGIDFYTSGANFIFFKPVDSVKALQLLSRNGIFVRPQSKTNIDGSLRLSIGTVKQMKKFINIYNKLSLYD